jgi:hypothetical protein
LGFYLGQEKNIPVDFDDVLRCIGPRPLLILAPERDRHHPVAAVKQLVAPAMQANKQLTFKTPDDYNRFSESMLEEMAGWLRQQKDDAK